MSAKLSIPGQKHQTSPISRDQAKDTGMAMTLLALIVGLSIGNRWFFIATIVLLVINMIVPDSYRPVAKVWFGFSVILGAIVSKVVLASIFFLVITPMGMLKKMFGSEPLQLRKWKKNSDSVFADRSHSYESRDLESPF